MRNIIVLKGIPDNIMAEVDFSENEIHLTICGQLRHYKKRKTPDAWSIEDLSQK